MYSPVSMHSSQSSVKKGAMSSSTPSSVRNPTGLETFKSLSDKFLGQIDIQLRASLYSLTTGDTTDVKSTLEHMRSAIKEFQSESDIAYNKAKLQSSAATQKMGHLNQYNSELSQQKNKLELKVKSLEQQLADILSETLPDDSVFDEDFVEPLTEDELPNIKKKDDPETDTSNAD